MKYILIITLFLSTSQLIAQEEIIHLHGYCSIDSERLEEDELIVTTASPEAEAILNTLIKVTDFSDTIIHLRASDVGLAVALVDNQKRYIIYDETFIKKAKKKGDEWAIYFVFAHELGHHFYGHTLLGIDERLTREMLADEFAAKTLAKLGATQTQTLAALQFFNEKRTETHPSKATREQIMIVNWKKGIKNKEELANKNKKYEVQVVLPSDNPRYEIMKLSTKEIIMEGYGTKNIQLSKGNYLFTVFYNNKVYREEFSVPQQNLLSPILD